MKCQDSLINITHLLENSLKFVDLSNKIHVKKLFMVY